MVRGHLRRYLPVAAGLIALYLPTYLSLCRTYWWPEGDAKAPIILLLVGWLTWQQRPVFAADTPGPWRAAGVMSLAFGLLAYVVGHSQGFYQLEVASQLPVLFGIVHLLTGVNGVRRLWFPIALLLFLVPVPGSILDQVLMPLKQGVSRIVDSGLHAAGYPIARSGVVLMIGPYKLLIADACSGLNSMVALTGIGLLYVHLARHAQRYINVMLLLGVLPIAFLANLLRVTLLVLITFYMGDAAGKTFHDSAAFLEILFAFGSFFALDSLLTHLDGKLAHRRVTPEVAHP